MAKRNPKVLGEWGKDTHRAIGKEDYFNLPYKWAGKAVAEQTRYRVFCGSLMDFCEDRQDLVQVRARVVNIIRLTCSHLDYLILTKRPENFNRLWYNAPSVGLNPAKILNEVWVGATVENQYYADQRIPHLALIPARCRFLSIEPVLERIDLRCHLRSGCINWVIVGGESAQAGKCRATMIDNITDIVDQCRLRGVPVFVKQLGTMPTTEQGLLVLGHKKGEDISEWPEHLQIQEVPSWRVKS